MTVSTLRNGELSNHGIHYKLIERPFAEKPACLFRDMRDTNKVRRADPRAFGVAGRSR